MRNSSQWMCSRITRLNLKINSAKESNKSGLTVVVNTMADMTDQVNNVQDPLLNSKKNVALSHSKLYRDLLARMVLHKDETE